MRSFLLRSLYCKNFTCGLFLIGLLCGCSTSTLDIKATSRKAFIGNISSIKPLSDRTARELNFAVTGTTHRQAVGDNGVQISGNRINSPEVLNNQYFFAALTANYQYHWFKGKRITHTVAPGVQLSYFGLNVSSESIDESFGELNAGLGLKFQTSIRLPDQMSLVFNFGLYDSRSSNVFFESGLWLLINSNKNARIRIGVGKLRYGDGANNNGDFCGSDSEFCDDSEIEVGSEGLLIGVEFR